MLTPDAVSQRFWTKVHKTQGCWLWLGSTNARGYGQFYWKRPGRAQSQYAHRVAYELTYGTIADGLELDHLCRTPSCVNPIHLEPVTHQVNMIRSVTPSCIANRTNVCQRGHEFTPENTYVRPDGTRKWCRECARMREQRRVRDRSKPQTVCDEPEDAA